MPQFLLLCHPHQILLLLHLLQQSLLGLVTKYLIHAKFYGTLDHHILSLWKFKVSKDIFGLVFLARISLKIHIFRTFLRCLLPFLGWCTTFWKELCHLLQFPLLFRHFLWAKRFVQLNQINRFSRARNGRKESNFWYREVQNATK